MKKHDNYINGEWIATEHYRENINPSDTSDVIGHYAQGTADDVARAIAAARAASTAWGGSNIQQRSDVLDRAGTLILERKQELGELLSREEGKTLPEGIGEVTRAGHIFKYFAAEALRIPGEKLDSVRPGIEVEITREPVGVVGLITPWNFPIAIPAWKTAPALAYGNTVVLKPADLTPGCAWALAEILHEAGVPAGVFNLVMGRGSVVGAGIVSSTDVDALSFTGSVETGLSLREQVVARSGKIQLEMGGKNPQVVLDDADLDVAVNCALQSAFFSTGQRCTASSRIIVTEGIHDRFVAAMAKKISQLKVGSALADGTQIGPLADAGQLAKSQEYIALGQQEGAALVAGGEALSEVDGRQGFYLTPALLADCNNKMRVCCEEIFGPVASVIKVRNYEEALAVANDTEFGLSAGIATQSLKYASDFKRRSQAGMVMVNLPTAGVDYHVPFGGSKNSSYGSREQGRYAVEFYTKVKTTYINAG